MFDPAGRTCTLADERFVLGSGEPICGVIFASQTQEDVAKRRNSPTSRLCKEAARSLDGPEIVTPGYHSNAGCTFYRQAKFSGFAFAQSRPKESGRTWIFCLLTPAKRPAVCCRMSKSSSSGTGRFPQKLFPGSKAPTAQNHLERSILCVRLRAFQEGKSMQKGSTQREKIH